jgi:ubiquitin-protein ligase
MSNVRLRRLQADHRNLVEYVRLHPRLRLVQAVGDPPEQYQIEYRIKSLRQVGDELKETKSHLVEISLPRNYPRTPPLCRMLTPVFHPNIAPHAICVGDHWSAGEPLKSIVARIGEMLAFQSYNVKSPLNGEAARWVERNLRELPLDEVSLLVEESSGAISPTEDSEIPADQSAPSLRHESPIFVTDTTATSPPRPKPDAIPDSSLEIAFAEPQQPRRMINAVCPNCAKTYQLDRGNLGQNARCSQCLTVFQITESSEGIARDSAPEKI